MIATMESPEYCDACYSKWGRAEKNHMFMPPLEEWLCKHCLAKCRVDMKKWKLTLGGRYLIFRLHPGPFMTWRFEIETGLTRWL